jgi:hypothetical protein
MPLIKSKSERAFQSNLKAELAAGKPKKQALAIAYNVQREAKKAKGGSLSVGRGEKLPVERGAGLTAKGREKYNRETGSNLKPPQPEGGARRDSFCARMGPVARKSEPGSRARASMKRWNCPGGW